jgi:carboxylesterase
MNATGFADWYGEVERAFDDLPGRCETVFAMGCRWAARWRCGWPSSGRGGRRPRRRQRLAGTARKDAKLLPLASRVLRPSPGIASDIKKPGRVELAYDRVPLKAAASLQAAWPGGGRGPAPHQLPGLVYRSRVDHVVPPVSGELLLRGLAGGTVEERVLEDSYHVATLDHDAPAIFDGSLDFVRSHTPAAAG